MPITEEENKILHSGVIDRNLYMSGGTDVVNSKLLLEKGKLISLRPHTRFAEFPEHSHDYIEVVYMCLGSTTHIINGREVRLSEGELLFLSRNARHSIKTATENDIAINFIILPEFFTNSLSSLGEEDTPLKRFITDSLDNTIGNSDYLLFKVSNELPVQNLVENLIWILLNDTRNKRMVNRITMELLFQHLMNCADSISYGDSGDELVVKFLKYIDDNYRDASLSEAAGLLFCDQSWLSREIKKRTGSNYTDLIRERRLSQAVFYLKNTNMKIADIVAAVGYDNASYFYRIFLGKYNMTPAEYRKKVK
jgi:AraC-like DNA-binding protein